MHFTRNTSTLASFPPSSQVEFLVVMKKKKNNNTHLCSVYRVWGRAKDGVKGTVNVSEVYEYSCFLGVKVRTDLAFRYGCHGIHMGQKGY